MVEHPQHLLQPFHRRAIYRKLDATKGQDNYPIRVILDLLTVRRILPPGQRKTVDDDRLFDMLKIAEDALNGRISKEADFEEASSAQVELERLDRLRRTAGSAEWSEYMLYTYNTALDTLFDASGSPQFDNVRVTKRTLDSDLDPWSTDVALWAAFAYAGPPWKPTSNPEKRKEFWEWWLLEAIPQAWDQAHR
jgi:hypothetical protein